MYSIYKFRSYEAANRKRNLHRFGLLGRGRSLDFIDDAPGLMLPIQLDGTKDGENKVFTSGYYTTLIKNGMVMKEGVDYSVTPSTNAVAQTVFVEAPLSDDIIWATAQSFDYYHDLRAESGKFRFEFTEIRDGERVQFALPPLSVNLSMIEIYRNGIQLYPNKGYSLSGSTVTFSTPPEADDDIWAILTP